jgi:hypothetical protein
MLEEVAAIEYDGEVRVVIFKKSQVPREGRR